MNLSNVKLPLPTPCIGVCSTVYGDLTCRGCKRHYQDIINWNAFSEDEKREKMQVIEDRLKMIFQGFAEILDRALFLSQTKLLKLRFWDEAYPFTVLYVLLRDYPALELSKIGASFEGDFTAIEKTFLEKSQEAHNALF
jgi:predicted Fe-S protein YdhL (DUF1289 family)